MAKSSLLYLILLTFIQTIAISSSHSHHNNNNNNNNKHYGFRSKQFTVYAHDIVNQTDFIIVPGIASISVNVSQTTLPFGTITVNKDNLTITSNPSSKVVGNVEALGIVSSFDGLDSLSVVRYALDLEDGRLHGTISALGVVNTLEPSQLPVTGGTGDFLLVQGYITTSLVSFVGSTFIYKADFHLYWPHYAPYATKP